ncbi:MAG: HPr(Ser) kinase/phosphatase [Deferribacteraceae bacterium]|jgi:HPr kinase/phosphorylase|nr:HPr(Ser) kinase/phosphatase [Deferribacteraceae bacterium]
MAKEVSARSIVYGLPQISPSSVLGEAFLDAAAVDSPRIQRPGLALAGCMHHIRQKRVQIFGDTEINYLSTLEEDKQAAILSELAKHNSSLYVVSKALPPPRSLIKTAETHKIPIALFNEHTMQVYNELTYCLEYILADETTMQGVCVEVYGTGIIIVGKSGIGKSECALELIKRGHRLIADDMISLRRKQHYIAASCSEVLQNRIELRGVGVLDISKMFGITSVRPRKKVDLIIKLIDYTEWNSDSTVDRLNTEETQEVIFGVPIPVTRCPVSPGRNMSEIVELVAKNHILRIMGCNTTKEFLSEVDRAAYGEIT